jgi:CheY-like chemotaxis protein
VQLVGDGESAVGMAETFAPDLILMDVGLPGMSGYEASRVIRSNERKKRITIVALTGWGQIADLRKSADAGIDQHLVKPLDFFKLRAILDRLSGFG